MAKIRTGDEVIVTAGKDKGRRGRILRVLKEKKRVIVEGINMMKKHVKPNPQANEQGGILEREAALNISNVALFNGGTNKGSRVGFKVLEDGRKVRYFKDNGEVIDV